MKHLTLIRHAKSSWAHASLSDFDRPLNPRGLADAPQMGARLRAMNLPPVDRMIHSPAQRARTTADLIAQGWGLAPECRTEAPQIYEASLDTLLTLVRGLDDADHHVVLVGHNPGFEQLAGVLVPEFSGDGEKFPTCGVCLIELEVDHWSAVNKGGALRHEFLYPKMS